MYSKKDMDCLMEKNLFPEHNLFSKCHLKLSLSEGDLRAEKQMDKVKKKVSEVVQ